MIVAVAVMRGKNAVGEERYVECTVMVVVVDEIQIRRVHRDSCRWREERMQLARKDTWSAP